MALRRIFTAIDIQIKLTPDDRELVNRLESLTRKPRKIRVELEPATGRLEGVLKWLSSRRITVGAVTPTLPAISALPSPTTSEVTRKLTESVRNFTSSVNRLLADSTTAIAAGLGAAAGVSFAELPSARAWQRIAQPPTPTLPALPVPQMPPAVAALPFLGEQIAGVGRAAQAASDSLLDAIGRVAPQLVTELPDELLMAASRMVGAGRITAEEAARAIATGFSRSKEVILELAATAEVSGSRMMSYGDALRNVMRATSGLEPIGPAVGALNDLSKQSQVLATAAALSARTLPSAAAAMGQVGDAARGSTLTLRQITLILRSMMAAAGIRAPATVVNMAARMVRSGSLTIEQAVEAMRLGMTKSGEVIEQMGTTASSAAKQLQRLMSVISGIGGVAPPRGGVPVGGVVEFPGGPVFGELPPAGRVLALANALDAAREAAGGLMQKLLTLRWQIFTVLFFITILASGVTSLINAIRQATSQIDAMRVGLGVLRATGINNVVQFAIAVQEASGNTISLAEAINVGARSALRGVHDEIIKIAPALMRYAQLMSIASGGAETSEEIFKKMMEAIQRGEIRMARTTGVATGTLTNLLDAFQQELAKTGEAMAKGESDSAKLARALLETGIAAVQSTQQLTPFQKQLLVAWQITRLGEQALSGVGSSFDETTRKISHLERAWEEFIKAVKAGITSLVAPVAQFLGDLIYAALGLPLLLARETPAFGALTSLSRILFQNEQAASAAAQAVSEVFSRIDEQKWEQLTPVERLSEMWKLLVDSGRAVLLIGQATGEQVDVNRDVLAQLKQILGGEEEIGRAIDENNERLKERQNLYLQALRQYLDYLVDLQREEEDIARRRARDEEDLQIDLRRKLEDIGRDLEKRREDARRQYDRRREEAARDLARRLAQIERDLAQRLTEIWRDYNDRLFDAIAERDAIAALMAQRERDRRIQEAHEWADDARRTAWEQYQDAIEDEQRQLEERLREINEWREQEMRDLQLWLRRRREDMMLSYLREDEDRRIAQQRRIEDINRQLQLELALQRIANNERLSEQQRFFQAALAMKKMYEQLLGRPIIIPIVPQPVGGWPGTQTGGGGGGRITPLPRQAGGLDIITRPTAFLAHPGEVVATVPLFRPSPMNVTVGGIVRHSVTAIVDSRIAGMEGRITSAITAALIQLFRSARTRV